MNTADVASYRNRKVLRYAPANTLVREVDKFNGRLRFCSGFEVLHGAFNPSVVRFSGDHQQDNSALMSHVFPWLNPCRNLEQLSSANKRQCEHITNIHRTWNLFAEPVFRSRFALDHSRSDMKVTSLVNSKRGIKLSALGVMDVYSDNAWDKAVVSDGNWLSLVIPVISQRYQK